MPRYPACDCKNCDYDMVLRVEAFTVYDTDDNIIIGPYDTPFLLQGNPWAINFNPGLPCPQGGAAVLFRCQRKTDGQGGLIPCTREYGIYIEVDCCNGSLVASYSDYPTSGDLYGPTPDPTSEDPFYMEIDVPLVAVATCVLGDGSSDPPTPARVTLIIRE